jgi:uncharacterized protein YbaA (DUF1428 family)
MGAGTHSIQRCVASRSESSEDDSEREETSVTIHTSPETVGGSVDLTAAYVDGFVIAVPRDRLDDYERLARRAASVWREYGAVQVVETVADDVPYGKITSFPRAVQAAEDETVIFSWIAYESREARDEVNAKVMADPRIKDHMNEVPFDPARMVFGGFRTIVEH